MTGAKDAPEVVTFITLFAKLKDWTDDDPDGLIDLTAADGSIRELCEQVGRRQLAWSSSTTGHRSRTCSWSLQAGLASISSRSFLSDAARFALTADLLGLRHT